MIFQRHSRFRDPALRSSNHRQRYRRRRRHHNSVRTRRPGSLSIVTWAGPDPTQERGPRGAAIRQTIDIARAAITRLSGAKQ